MLDTALADELISQEEADLFLEVHAVMDTHMADTAMEPMSGNMEDQLSAMLASLVEMGEISQVQGDSFQDLHTRLLDAGLMQ